jgi:hypothetical protein
MSAVRGNFFSLTQVNRLTREEFWQIYYANNTSVVHACDVPGYIKVLETSLRSIKGDRCDLIANFTIKISKYLLPHTLDSRNVLALLDYHGVKARFTLGADEVPPGDGNLQNLMTLLDKFFSSEMRNFLCYYLVKPKSEYDEVNRWITLPGDPFDRSQRVDLHEWIYDSTANVVGSEEEVYDQTPRVFKFVECLEKSGILELGIRLSFQKLILKNEDEVVEAHAWDSDIKPHLNTKKFHVAHWGARNRSGRTKVWKFRGWCHKTNEGTCVLTKHEVWPY